MHLILTLDILGSFQSPTASRGYLYSTSSQVPYMVHNIRTKLSESSENEKFTEATKQLAMTLLRDLEENQYRGSQRVSMTIERGCRDRQISIHPYIWIAAALDPRMKSLSFVHSEVAKQQVWDTILELMIEIKRKQT